MSQRRPPRAGPGRHRQGRACPRIRTLASPLVDHCAMRRTWPRTARRGRGFEAWARGGGGLPGPVSGRLPMAAAPMPAERIAARPDRRPGHGPRLAAGRARLTVSFEARSRGVLPSCQCRPASLAPPRRPCTQPTHAHPPVRGVPPRRETGGQGQTWMGCADAGSCRPAGDQPGISRAAGPLRSRAARSIAALPGYAA